MDQLNDTLEAARCTIDGTLGELKIGNKILAKKNWMNIQDTLSYINDLFNDVDFLKE